MRILKLAAWGLGGLAAASAFALAGGFVASEVMIRQRTQALQGVAQAAQDPGAVARGRKVATVNGCLSCHGSNLQGALFHDEPMLLKGYAPNLTFAAARYTDRELDAAIRKGVAPQGRALWIMPSAAFAYMSDRDAADLLAYIRSVPLGGRDLLRTEFGPILRAAIVLGKLQSEPKRLERNRGLEPEAAGPGTAYGRQIARACIECHGPTLAGDPLVGAPDLMVAGAYDEAAFEKLMRLGVAADGRRIAMMAPPRFGALTAQERAALLAYLKARGVRRAQAAERGAAPRDAARRTPPPAKIKAPIVLCARPSAQV